MTPPVSFDRQSARERPPLWNDGQLSLQFLTACCLEKSMKVHVLFIHGAGDTAYDQDASMAASLRTALGDGYELHFPRMPKEDSADGGIWIAHIAEQLAALGDGVIAAGHSAGGATLAMCLAQRGTAGLRAICLIAPPFCGEGGWDCGEFVLPADLGKRISADVPFFLYQGTEDEVVPVDHLALYARELPHAKVRRLAGRDHQLNDDLTEVAADIKALVAR
jgi:pimeloyl-ACP methyl ester carboxylesterase